MVFFELLLDRFRGTQRVPDLQELANTFQIAIFCSFFPTSTLQKEQLARLALITW